jgi:hypothetical protein
MSDYPKKDNDDYFDELYPSVMFEKHERSWWGWRPSSLPPENLFYELDTKGKPRFVAMDFATEEEHEDAIGKGCRWVLFWIVVGLAVGLLGAGVLVLSIF